MSQTQFDRIEIDLVTVPTSLDPLSIRLAGSKPVLFMDVYPRLVPFHVTCLVALWTQSLASLFCSQRWRRCKLNKQQHAGRKGQNYNVLCRPTWRLVSMNSVAVFAYDLCMQCKFIYVTITPPDNTDLHVFLILQGKIHLWYPSRVCVCVRVSARARERVCARIHVLLATSKSFSGFTPLITTVISLQTTHTHSFLQLDSNNKCYI